MTNAALSLLNVEVIRFYAGSTNVDSRLTFNSNSQRVVSFDSVKAIIMDNRASAQTQLGLDLASVTQESQESDSTSTSTSTTTSTSESFSCNFPLSSIDRSKFKLQ
jgi:hypothetical protein